MTESDLQRFKVWFTTFVRSYAVRDEEERKSFNLKEEHTYKACDDVRTIGEALKLSENDLLLAESIALFHDIGRFPQYSNFRTFRDSISVNHGELGADTLQAEKVLKDLQPHEEKIILESVRYHNAFNLPDSFFPEAFPFLKMIRDADKLDIWRVFVDFYNMSWRERISAISLGLPDVPRISPNIVDYIMKKKVIPLAMVRTLNDFRLMQLSWVYDINYTVSLRLLVKRDYIRQIAPFLPDTEEVREAIRFLSELLIQKLVCGEENDEGE